MSPKRKTKQPPVNISIGGNVKGIGIVVGNESQSHVTVSTSAEKPDSSSRMPKIRSVWNVVPGIVSKLLMNLFGEK